MHVKRIRQLSILSKTSQQLPLRSIYLDVWFSMTLALGIYIVIDRGEQTWYILLITVDITRLGRRHATVIRLSGDYTDFCHRTSPQNKQIIKKSSYHPYEFYLA